MKEVSISSKYFYIDSNKPLNEELCIEYMNSLDGYIVIKQYKKMLFASKKSEEEDAFLSDMLDMPFPFNYESVLNIVSKDISAKQDELTSLFLSHSEGHPDVLVIDTTNEKAYFVEIKAETDSLRQSQLLFLEKLNKIHPCFVFHLYSTGSGEIQESDFPNKKIIDNLYLKKQQSGYKDTWVYFKLNKTKGVTITVQDIDYMARLMKFGKKFLDHIYAEHGFSEKVSDDYFEKDKELVCVDGKEGYFVYGKIDGMKNNSYLLLCDDNKLYGFTNFGDLMDIPLIVDRQAFCSLEQFRVIRYCSQVEVTSHRYYIRHNRKPYYNDIPKHLYSI